MRVTTLPSAKWKWSVLPSSAVIFLISEGFLATSATKASSVASGICFEAQYFLPLVLNVEQIQTTRVAVVFLRKFFPHLAHWISPVYGNFSIAGGVAVCFFDRRAISS